MPLIVIFKETYHGAEHVLQPSLACLRVQEYAKLGDINQEEFYIPMQRPDPKSTYYKDFHALQKRLCKKIKKLREEHGYTQEDMTDFELSLRQYQRMEQDPSSIVSLWQVYKIAKAFNLDMDELLNEK